MASDESEQGLVKVAFVLEPGAWHGSATETLWAKPLGGDQFRLENSPFYAFGVSFQDIVVARKYGDKFMYVQVTSRGGHSTYRILPKAGRLEDLDRFWKPIQAAGCTYEQGAKGMLSVDVPSQADIASVYQLLRAGEDSGVWSFEEGHCGHAVA